MKVCVAIAPGSGCLILYTFGALKLLQSELGVAHVCIEVP